MTEWPLHHTISDFWSMVYDHEGEIILIKLKLNELESNFFFLDLNMLDLIKLSLSCIRFNNGLLNTQYITQSREELIKAFLELFSLSRFLPSWF